MRIHRSDIVPVLVITLLAAVVMTMFLQDGYSASDVPMQASYSVTAQGWGQVR